MTLPLLTLKPLVDVHHRWVGVVLRLGSGDAASGREGLDRLFDHEHFADALGARAICVADADAGVLAELAPELDRRKLLAMNSLTPPQLVRGVDSHEGFDAARAAGAQWILGNYALCPAPVTIGTMGPAQTTLITLLGQVTRDADTRDIEQTLKRDSQLSFQLLKLVNSVAFATQKHISSFSQAIAILGRRQLQRWLQLLMYAQQNRHEADISPLLPRAAQRAAMMESLVIARGGSQGEQEQAFMVGMFSLLNLLLGQPLATVIDPLHLPQPITDALLQRKGPLGALLLAVEARDGTDDVALATAVAGADVDAAMWCHAEVQAARWALQVGAG